MVKKIFWKTLFPITLAILLLIPAAMAEDDGKIRVTLNGADIPFDAAPAIMGGRTMVPMRAVFEVLGMDVIWEEDTRTVTAAADGTSLTLTVGETIVVKETPDGQEIIVMDTSPVIRDDRTLVPIRFIAESTGCYVGWDERTQTVIIVSPVLPQNVGRLYYEDSDAILYLGEIRDSLPNGKGTYFYENGSVLCIGEFKDGEMNGSCTVYGVDFVKSGNYKDGELVIGESRPPVNWWLAPPL